MLRFIVKQTPDPEPVQTTFYPLTIGDDGDGQTGPATWSNTRFSFIPNNTGYAFLRLPSVTIPQGSTITNAYLKLYCENNRTPSSLQAVITGEDVDNATQVISYADFSARNNTTEDYTWVLTGQSFVAGTQYDSPNISNVIQEVINRPGWTSGNALQLLFICTGNWNQTILWGHFGSPNPVQELHITYLS